MAASENINKSNGNGSEEMFEVCCSSCNDDGRTTEAKKYCVECGLHYCENCVRFHKKIPALQSHQIVKSQDGSQDKGERMDLPTERCANHHGKLMDMFCGDHDEICCGVCIAVKHRACIKVKKVQDVAKGIRSSEEFTDVKDSITQVLDNMKQQKNKRTTNLTNLKHEKNQILQEVDKYEDELSLKVKELAEASRQEIRSKYEKLKEAIAADVETLDTLVSATDTNLQKLSITNEAQLFVNVKASKTAIKDGDAVLREMSTGWTDKQLTYSFDENLKNDISNTSSFGNIEDTEDVKEYKATLYGKFNVKENTDKRSVIITGICTLQNGSLLIIDYNNRMLKRLDSNYLVKDTVALDGRPIGICKTGRNEVAVSLYQVGKVVFISADNGLKLASAIAVDRKCYGIFYDDSMDEMFACCGTCINVYNKSGTVLRTYKNGIKGEPLFSHTRQVTQNVATNQIVVADESQGLVAIKVKGTGEWVSSDKELVGSWGLCSLPYGLILVSGETSGNAVQVDKTGKKLGVLLGKSEGLFQPYSLAFDKHTSRLIVGCNSNEILVYTLS